MSCPRWPLCTPVWSKYPSEPMPIKTKRFDCQRRQPTAKTAQRKPGTRATKSAAQPSASSNSAGQSLSDSTQTTAPNLQAKLELKL